MINAQSINVPADEEKLSFPGDRLSALDIAIVPVWLVDIDALRIIWGNMASLDLWKVTSVEELQEIDLSAQLSLTLKKGIKAFARDLQHGRIFNDIWTIFAKGEPIPIRFNARGLALADGRIGMLVQAFPKDNIDPISLRGATALNHVSTMVTIYSARSGKVLYENVHARNAHLPEVSGIGDKFVDSKERALLLKSVKNNLPFNSTVQVDTLAGRRWHDVAVVFGNDPVSGRKILICNETDVTDRMEATQQVRHLAHHDSLTALPNRAYFEMELEAQLNECAYGNGNSGALMFVDLDKFKAVNDTHGHQCGDELLVNVAGILRECCSNSGFVARLGGDEFVVVMPGCGDDEAARKIGEEIIARLSAPMTLCTASVEISCTIGVAIYPRDGTTMKEIMRHADVAMYNGKRGGRSCVAVYSQELGELHDEYVYVRDGLQAAFANDEFLVHYQPRFALSSQYPVGAEALLRWNHPERGILTPRGFIKVAECSEMVARLDLTTITASLREIGKHSCVPEDFMLSVNVSAESLTARDFGDQLTGLIENSPIKPQNLGIELPGKIFAGGVGGPPAIVEQLKRAGCQIVINDFGDGCDNLSSLEHKMVDRVKCAGRYLRYPHGHEMLKFLCSLCQRLDRTVTIKGVETKAQLQMIQNYNVDEFQGILRSPPVALRSLVVLLEKYGIGDTSPDSATP